MPVETLVDELKEAAESLRACRAERDRIRRVLHGQQANLTQTKVQYAEAFANLSTVESDSALGRATEVKKVRAGYIETRNNIEFLDAAVRGLTEQLKVAETNVEAANDGFRREWLKFASSRIAGFQQQFDEAVHALHHTIAQGLAISEALFDTSDGSRVHYRLRNIVSHPILAIDGDAKRYAREQTNWADDPIAAQLNKEIKDLKVRLLGGGENNANIR